MIKKYKTLIVSLLILTLIASGSLFAYMNLNHTNLSQQVESATKDLNKFSTGYPQVLNSDAKNQQKPEEVIEEKVNFSPLIADLNNEVIILKDCDLAIRFAKKIDDQTFFQNKIPSLKLTNPNQNREPVESFKLMQKRQENTQDALNLACFEDNSSTLDFLKNYYSSNSNQITDFDKSKFTDQTGWKIDNSDILDLFVINTDQNNQNRRIYIVRTNQKIYVLEYFYDFLKDSIQIQVNSKAPSVASSAEPETSNELKTPDVNLPQEVKPEEKPTNTEVKSTPNPQSSNSTQNQVTTSKPVQANITYKNAPNGTPNTLNYNRLKIEAPIVFSKLEDLFEKNSDGTINFKKPIEEKAEDVKNKNYTSTPIQKLLMNGIVHLATSARPGEIGNSYIVGHSSNYKTVISKYNYIFANLGTAKIGDEFIIYDQNGKAMVFKVFENIAIDDNDVSVAYKDYADKRVVTLQASILVGGKPLKRRLVRGERV